MSNDYQFLLQLTAGIFTTTGRQKKTGRFRKDTTHMPLNPVCERRVNLLVYSLSLHRHSYIGFILAFASSIHNEQQHTANWRRVDSSTSVFGLSSHRVSTSLQLQEFCQCNQIVDSTTSSARLSLPRSKGKLVWLLQRR